jgi:hypothetical protein
MKGGGVKKPRTHKKHFKERSMKLDNGKMTGFLSFPDEETEKVINAMSGAEKAADMKALQWCARRLVWLAANADRERGDDESYPAHLFNRDWEDQLKDDPPPESIQNIITCDHESEPSKIGHRGDALALLDEMIAKCEKTNSKSPPEMRGMDKAIGSAGYFWPRLTALKDAIERWIV